MAAGLFSIFQQCERKVRSIMHLTPTLLIDGQTRGFFQLTPSVLSKEIIPFSLIPSCNE